jgi:hypothetical protein
VTRTAAWQIVRVFSLAALVPAAAGAQQVAASASRLNPSVRADAIIDRDPGAQLAVGLALPTAFNVRLVVDVGGGGAQRANGWVAGGRVDLLARVLSDPSRKARWALNAGGGFGERLEQRARPRTVAIVTVGLDGPSDGAWVPGVELGLGGGVRAGLTFRRTSRTRR